MAFIEISARGRRARSAVAAEWLGLCAGLACGGPAASAEESTGQGELSIGFGLAASDVTTLRIDVVAADDDCSGDVIASDTVELAPASAPEPISSSHRHESSLLLLPAGDVRVCVTPLVAGQPSARCQMATDIAHVDAGQTTSVDLVMQCGTTEDGALSAVITFNEAPLIQALRVDPSAVITTCDTATLSLAASDVDGDALSYVWSVGDAMRARPYEGEIQSNGPRATFSSALAGDYRVNVAVDDGHGGRNALSAPIQVVDGACGEAR
jgi:hypothetical protein